MFFAVFFVSLRIFEIVTLIPIVGMLAWFVNDFTDNNSLTPASVLVLFIVSVIALAWALFTLFSYHRSSTNAHFIALIDLAIFGALIAGVYYLRGIADVSCSNVIDTGNDWTRHLPDLRTSGPGVEVAWRTKKRCSMLKACFAFGIIDTVLFFMTAVTALLHGNKDDDRRPRHSHHSDRHSHRRRSHSGSRHSHHSHRRVYV